MTDPDTLDRTTALLALAVMLALVALAWWLYAPDCDQCGRSHAWRRRTVPSRRPARRFWLCRRCARRLDVTRARIRAALS